MSTELVKPERLVEFREQLRRRYLLSVFRGIAEKFGCATSSTIEGLQEEMKKSLKVHGCANGPDSCFEELLRQGWFNGCAPLTPQEYARRIRKCLEPVELSSEDFTDSFFAHPCAILNARPHLWNSRDGFFVMTDQEPEGAVDEIRAHKDGFIFHQPSDEYLRWCLLCSWKYTKDRTIADAAREQILQDFWEAWEVEWQDWNTKFGSYAYVIGNPERIPRYVYHENDIWVCKTPPSVLVFHDLMACSDGWIVRTKNHAYGYYTVPSLRENTAKLSEWIKELSLQGYPGLCPDAWNVDSIPALLQEPLIRKRRWFQSLPRTCSLGDVLLEGMMTLGLDQAFFGDTLITHIAYEREPSLTQS